jgi:RHS repeat-associated protein
VLTYANTADNSGATTTYSYTNNNQLLSASGTVNNSYTYDTNGNRLTTGSQTTNSTIATGNRLIDDGTYHYTYDAEGNLTGRLTNATGVQLTLTWDHRNRLTEITEREPLHNQVTYDLKYEYDSFNDRVSRTETTYTFGDGGEGHSVATGSTTKEEKFIYDGDHVVLDFVSPTLNASYTLEHRYLYGPAVDQVLAQENVTNPANAGSVLWMLTDNEGTVRDLVDNSGSLVQHYKYDAYGNVLAGSNTSWTRYLYTGREFDSTTGLQYNRERWYDPGIGRWLSEDPIGFDGGQANLYEYVGNSATNWTDPSGLFGISIAFNAFIPRSKGTVIHGVEMPGVNWGVEPGQLPFKSRYRYFSTDDREFAGQAGTSRVKLSGQFDSCQIGSLKALSGSLFTASADPSHQLEADNGGLLGPSYVSGSLKAKTATASKIEWETDSSKTHSGITVGASGGYPFVSVAPNIDYGMSMSATRNCDGSVRLSAVGSHNEFPAYEIIVNGTVVYKSYPTGSGPGLINLNSSDSFSFQITISANGTVQKN